MVCKVIVTKAIITTPSELGECHIHVRVPHSNIDIIKYLQATLNIESTNDTLSPAFRDDYRAKSAS